MCSHSRRTRSARELGGKLLQLVAADGLEMEPVAGAALGEPLDAVELCARACCDDGQDGARGSAQRVDDRVHGLGVGPLRVVEDERGRRVAFEHVEQARGGVPVEQLVDDAERDPRLGRLAARPQHAQVVVAGEEGFDQGRLADARGALQQDGLRLARPRGGQRGLQHRELRPPAGEGFRPRSAHTRPDPTCD